MKESRAAYKPEAKVTAGTLITILAAADFDQVTMTGRATRLTTLQTLPVWTESFYCS